MVKTCKGKVSKILERDACHFEFDVDGLLPYEYSYLQNTCKRLAYRYSSRGPLRLDGVEAFAEFNKVDPHEIVSHRRGHYIHSGRGCETPE